MPREFPYSIVDREPRRESHLIDYLFDLLDFFEGRATNREVLDLMDSLPSRSKMNGKMLISNYSGNGSVIVMRIRFQC